MSGEINNQENLDKQSEYYGGLNEMELDNLIVIKNPSFASSFVLSSVRKLKDKLEEEGKMEDVHSLRRIEYFIETYIKNQQKESGEKENG